MTSDIFLKQDRIEAVTTDENSLAVTTGKDENPDIRLTPNSARLTLGGGDGDYSDGDIRLMDRPDNGGSKPRVHLTGGTGTTASGTRVRIDGSDGTTKLGVESADDPDIELLPDGANIKLGGGSGGGGTVEIVDEGGEHTISLESDPDDASGGALTLAHESGPVTVDASGGQGRLTLGNSEAGADGRLELESDSGEQTATLASNSAESNGAALALAHKSGIETASIEGGAGTLSLGSSAADGGVGGSIDLVNSGGVSTVNVESDRPSGASGIALRTDSGDTTADIDAEEREMELGGAGVGGTLLLTDGEGTTFELTVQDGTIRLGSADNGKVAIELEPDEGIFSIVDGDGDTGLQVDTQRKTIKKGMKYTGGVVDHGS